MRLTALCGTLCLAVACAPTPKTVEVSRAVHTATARDTAFVRANCAMPDSVLAGTMVCIDRAQASKVRVF